MPTIRIDDEVWNALQAKAKAFVDTPNDVLRRVLGLEDPDRIRIILPRRRQRGIGTNDKAYYVPILAALVELGGKGAVPDVLNKVEESMRPQLKPTDFDALDSGEIRWRKSAQFARNDMVHRMNPPLLNPTARRGLWQITDEGREYLRRQLLSS